jgi:hypothetical protein
VDEDSLCGLIEGGIMPGSGQQLADTLTALPDFADSLEKWLKRLGEWMGERGLDAALAAQVTEMGGHAATIAGLAGDVSDTFERNYEFWLNG